jgi:hypothetical protein
MGVRELFHAVENGAEAIITVRDAGVVAVNDDVGLATVTSTVDPESHQSPGVVVVTHSGVSNATAATLLRRIAQRLERTN